MNSAVEYSGLEFLNHIKDGTLPYSPMAQTIPMKVIEVEKGKVAYLVTPDERHLNTLGGVHGGFYATVIDTITGGAIHTMLEAGINFGTIDLNVKMCRPVPKDKELLAIGSVINLSKNLAISEGKLVDEDGKLYAHATATCMIIRP